MFVCYNGAAASNARFFQKGAGSSTGSECCFGLTGVATNARFVRHNAGGTVTAAHQLTTVMANGTRVCVVITHDQSSGTSTAPVGYINGALSATTTFTPAAGIAQNNTDPFLIGNTDAGGNPMSSGLSEPISDFAVWDGAILSADQALALAQGVSPLLVAPAALVTYCPMGPLQIALDLINGQTLTFPNGAPSVPTSTVQQSKQFSFPTGMFSR